MHPKLKSILLTIYRICLCVSIFVAGLCLMAQCLSLYRSGADQPFTTESVAAAFAEIAVPVYFCGAMVLLGVLLAPCFPAPKKKAEKNYDLILDRLESTIDLNACPEEMQGAVMQLLVRRRVTQVLGWCLLVIGSVIFLCYGADPEHFHSTEISGSMAKAMYWLLPCMAVPFGYGIFAVYYRKRSIQKEIALLKTAPKEARCEAEPEENKPFPAHWLRFGILAVALMLLVGGYLMGGAVDVLTKAVNICTECIGLG